MKSYEQLHFLQQLLDSIPIPVFYKNTDGLYLGCNKAFETFIGLPRSRIVGKTVYHLAPKDLADVYHEADSVLIHQPGVQVYEGSLLHADGTKHNVIFNKAIYVDANGNVSGIVGAIMDITERKNLEAQLNQAQKMEAIGQLAGGIAHDFNNILTAIIGYSEILTMRMDKDNPLRRHVEQVLNSAGRAVELTSGLLAFSRKQVLHPKPLDLGETVLDLKKMLRRLILEDIDFKTTVAVEQLIVMADKGQIVQVLMNLVTNARDAMPRGGTLEIDVSPAVIDEKFILDRDGTLRRGRLSLKPQFPATSIEVLRLDFGTLGIDTTVRPPNATALPLRIGAKTYKKGLGVHANAEIAVWLDGRLALWVDGYAPVERPVGARLLHGTLTIWHAWDAHSRPALVQVVSSAVAVSFQVKVPLLDQA